MITIQFVYFFLHTDIKQTTIIYGSQTKSVDKKFQLNSKSVDKTFQLNLKSVDKKFQLNSKSVDKKFQLNSKCGQKVPTEFKVWPKSSNWIQEVWTKSSNWILKVWTKSLMYKKPIPGEWERGPGTLRCSVQTSPQHPYPGSNSPPQTDTPHDCKQHTGAASVRLCQTVWSNLFIFYVKLLFCTVSFQSQYKDDLKSLNDFEKQ